MTEVRGSLKGNALIRLVKSKLSAEQVCAYLQRVGWSEGRCYSAEDVDAGRFPATLRSLQILVRRHILSFPLETTPMHYTAEHYLDVSLEATFKRLVIDKKGGTYCYGHNGLMLEVLRGLGYRAYLGISRVNTSYFMNTINFTSFSHMILFVQLGMRKEDCRDGPASTDTWLVDVSPGLPVPLLPILLSDDPRNVLVEGYQNENGKGEMNRLTKALHPDSSLVHSQIQTSTAYAAHAIWQLEFREGGSNLESDSSSGFIAIYQFSEEEFTHADFAAHHYMLMNNPSAEIFSDDIVVARYVLADTEEHGEEKDVLTWPIEKRTMFRGVVKRRILGAQEDLETIKLTSEVHRVEVLRKYFGIMIEEGDIEHIKDRSAALEKVQPFPDIPKSM